MSTTTVEPGAAGPKTNRIGLTVIDYKGGKTTLCAGCGHNAISERIIEAMYEMGVEPELANDTQQSFRKGEIVDLPAERVSSTLADGLRTQSIGPINFEHIRRYVDDIITVSESEIRAAMRRMAMDAHLIAEPSGAVPFAAWLFHGNELPDSKKTVAVVSGGNVDPQLLAEVLNEAATR